MSLRRAIQTFFRDPPTTSQFADVVPGVNIVEGIATVEEPLRSPVRGQNCVGFHYRSWLILRSPRNPQPQVQPIKEAEVYAPFTLMMDGGTVAILPGSRSRFTRDTHQELKNHYGSDYHSVEDVILPGARVRIRGTVRMVDGRPTLKMSLISVLEKQQVQKGVVGDRKRRKRSQQTSA